MEVVRFSRVLLLISLAAVLTGCASPGKPSSDDQARAVQRPDKVWVEELDLDGMEQSWARPRAGRSVDDNPLTIGGWVLQHGIGTHALSEMTILLDGGASEFRALVGVDDEVGDLGTAAFVVLVDGKEAARTPVLSGADGPKSMVVDLRGARSMTLLVENGGDDINYDHADWGAAMIQLDPDATAMPQVRVHAAGPEPELAYHVPLSPVIQPPHITGGTPGRPFLLRVPTTGERPIEFSATNLPPGLHIDVASGILSGSIESTGVWEVAISAKNEHGEMQSTLTIVGKERALALTPPMGWNSWNVWGTAVDDAKVRAAADWMVSSGLADHGYHYINIDDAWEGERDEKGRMTTNEKFPDMKALADYVHSKGLKLGIYSSPGPKTCAGYEGSYEHEFQDAETFAEWGIDLLKHDWCSYFDIAKDDSREELTKPYLLMREALDACGRDIVFSLCQYGMGNVSEWGAEVGGNYWRTTGDIFDSWSSMSTIGFGQAGLEEYAGPGHWNDPDMLVVGKVGWGPELHDTRLSKNEQVTHMTLWSLLASPLLIGCDLSQIDDFTMALLANPEVLAVSQDRLGRQASQIRVEDRLEVWARPLADGTMAVGLFNRTWDVAEVAVSWQELGITGPQAVRDLWRRVDLGEHAGGFEADVAGHGAVMLKVTPLE